MLKNTDAETTSFRPFLSKLFDGKIPDYYEKLETKYEDYRAKVAEINEQEELNEKLLARRDEIDRQIAKNNEIIAKKSKQIEKFKTRSWAIALCHAIILETSERFNVRFTRSFLRRLFSTSKFTLLDQAHDYLQTCSSFEDFERELNRILGNYHDMMKLFRRLEEEKKRRELEEEKNRSQKSDSN